MDLKELSKLDIKDLKNLDYQAIYTKLKKRPDIIIDIAVILAMLIFCIMYYGNQKAALSAQSITLMTLEKKERAFTELQQAQEALKSLKSAIPEPIQESQLIDIITQNASEHNISIASFSPAVTAVQPAGTTITLSLDITAPSYTHLWTFIYQLESKYTAIRIDTWSGQMISANVRQWGRTSKDASADPNSINASLTITAVNFKND